MQIGRRKPRSNPPPVPASASHPYNYLQILTKSSVTPAKINFGSNSNRHLVRLESDVTSRKQSSEAHSNRHEMTHSSKADHPPHPRSVDFSLRPPHTHFPECGCEATAPPQAHIALPRCLAHRTPKSSSTVAGRAHRALARRWGRHSCLRNAAHTSMNCAPTASLTPRSTRSSTRARMSPTNAESLPFTGIEHG